MHDHPQGVINLREEPLPYIRLRGWFELASPRPNRENIVVVEVDGAKAGLAVDSLQGSRQTVIKPLGDQFKDLPGISGSAIMGNGRVALILDVAALMREVIRYQGNVRARGGASIHSSEEPSTNTKLVHPLEPRSL